VFNLRLNPELTLPRRLHSPGSEAARPPPSASGISPPLGGRSGMQSTFHPTAISTTAPGTVFPWPAARGFCTPCPNCRPRGRSACPQPPSAFQIQPLGLPP
jgi:hypothetical protein